MRKIFRVFVILLIAGTVLFASTGVALAAAVVHSGVITVSVVDHSNGGTRIFVPVPAALVNLGVDTLPLWMPAEERRQMQTELAPYREHLLALGRELAEMPDTTLVEVETDDEHVRVIKEGDTFRVIVDSPDADVRVSIPAHFFHRVLKAVA